MLIVNLLKSYCMHNNINYIHNTKYYDNFFICKSSAGIYTSVSDKCKTLDKAEENAALKLLLKIRYSTV